MARSIIGFKVVLELFSNIVLVSCIAGCIALGWQCLRKFESKPFGISIKTEYQTDVDFPSLTLCPHSTIGLGSPLSYNRQKLETCGINISNIVYDSKNQKNMYLHCSVLIPVVT